MSIIRNDLTYSSVAARQHQAVLTSNVFACMFPCSPAQFMNLFTVGNGPYLGKVGRRAEPFPETNP